MENEPKNKQKKYVPRIEKDNQNSANSPKEFICFCPHFVHLKNSLGSTLHLFSFQQKKYAAAVAVAMNANTDFDYTPSFMVFH